ncbi:hypothetical protein CROQUDRAFT_151936 [Cronartium quercuum f. sp. fusiforme G11]|uniref:Uncharacterized protein n=1 Tax=Cronartium quercuum f. sp. fusiforme G11 TaxID=708437 RepID=A0A9P6TIC6_9BASI|nr:hypothetical protein CROQUDRAFT_151936 [Cronartium quercuum f. sp. fusiforme G11]
MNQPGMLHSYPRPQTQMLHPPLHNQGVGGPSTYREGPPQASYGNIGNHQHINGQHMNGGMRGGGGQHMNGGVGGSGVMSSTSGPAYVAQPQHHHRTGPNRAGGAPHHSYPPSSSSSSSSRGNSYRPSTRLPQPAPNLSLPPRPLMPYEATNTNTNTNNNEPPILGPGSKFSIGINNSHSIYNQSGPPQNHNGIVYNHLSGPPPPATISYDRSQPILPQSYDRPPQSYDRSLSTYNHDRSTNEPNYNTTRNSNNNGYNQQGSSYDRNSNGRGNSRNNNRSSGQRHDRWVPPPNHQPSQRSYPPPSWSTNDNLNPPPPPPPPHSNYRGNGQDDGPPLQY